MFYIILCKNRTIGSGLLRLLMWSRYSHSAVYDAETDTVYDTTLLQGGCKKHTKAEFDAKYPFQDQLREVPVVASVVPEARKWLEAQLGKGYDWTALLGFVFQKNWQKAYRWFCSEHSETFRSLFSTPRFVLGAWRITPHHQYIITP